MYIICNCIQYKHQIYIIYIYLNKLCQILTISASCSEIN